MSYADYVLKARIEELNKWERELRERLLKRQR